MALLVDPKDVSSTDNGYFLQHKVYHTVTHRVSISVAIPFCTTRILAQFVSCKYDEDNQEKYAHSWKPAARFFRYSSGIAKPEPPLQHELERSQTTKHSPFTIKHPSEYISVTSSAQIVHSNNKFLFVCGIVTKLVLAMLYY